MNGKNSVDRKKKIVWRISESAPLGEFIDSAIPTTAPGRAKPSDVVQPGWAISSFELMRGVDISEDAETLPADLFDQLFRDVDAV